MKVLLNLDSYQGRIARLALWLSIITIILLLDFYTKQWASRALELYRPKEVFSWLNLTLAHNYGMAFSFLSDQQGWQRWFLTVVGIIISIFLFIWLLRLPVRERLTGVALSLVLGGAIGNLIDRVLLGYVVDFIDVYRGDWHWPAFNIADSAISVGVVLLLVDGLILQRLNTDDPDSAEPPTAE
jgi:signal peptidase II